MSTPPIFIKNLYPFKSNYLDLGASDPSHSGPRLHYVDEGEGRPLLMVHGNPSWSFLYRNLILGLKHKYRCIAPDHIGCGLSDKPLNYNYTLAQHIQNLRSLVRRLGLKEFDLVVHDWGGPIGLKIAQEYASCIKTILILNTSAFLSQRLPWQIRLCRLPYVGAFLVRGLNAFARGATYLGVSKPLSREAREGFCYPYATWQSRVAIQRFIQDIPLEPSLGSYPLVQQIDKDLSLFKDLNVHLLWGMKDFCFSPHFLEGFKQRLPFAKVYPFAEAGHYVLEDAAALKQAISILEEA